MNSAIPVKLMDAATFRIQQCLNKTDKNIIIDLSTK
jgi:hypothetical protein